MQGLQSNPTHGQVEPTAHEGAEGHEGHTGPVVVLFIIFGLSMGAILREVNKKTRIPYTPMCLILGIFLGYMKESLGVIGQSTSIIEKLNPHMILLIFIPTLLFESAFNCDWHVFRKSLVNIMILAGPGVLWGAILIGCCFKLVLMYPEDELTWYQAFTLGCVLSATDPVAVVALLKDLGASVRFNTLVEGQSLMNDGTAMVFFMLFMDLAKGNASSAVGVVVNFVRIAFGGPLLGLLVGLLMSFWLKRIIRDSVLSVNITFVGAYLCFYIAEFTWVKVSGILAVVVLGLYMSAVGKKKIYPQSQHAMHSVWGYIQYSCETLIFILTGCVVGVEMIEESTIRFSDWVRMFLFWFLMIALRAAMVFTFYPFIKNTGYGVSKKEVVVLIYGGLRGALGLCLSLIIGFDQQLPQRFRQITVFYMCGMAMLTIIVNGLTCGKIVNYVEMISYPEIKRKLLKRSIRTVLNKTQQKLKEIKSEPDMAYAKWIEVQQIAGTKKLGTTIHERSSAVGYVHNDRDSLRDVKKADMINEIRFRFTRYLHKIYWELYEEGELSEEAVGILSNCCDIVNDDPNIKMNHFEVLSRNFTMGIVKYYMKLIDTPIIGAHASRMVIQKIYFAYEITTTFLESCEEAIHTFKETFPLSHENLQYVMEEVRQNMDQAIAYIAQIENGYPTIIQAVHTVRAATLLLKYKKHYLKEMYDEGFIDESDYNVLRKQIDTGLVEVQVHDFKFEKVHFNEVLTECPLFSSLSPSELATVRSNAADRVFEKGTIIQTKGKDITNVYFVVSGTVRESFDNFFMIRGIGCMLNPYDFIYKETSKCVVKAQTRTTVLLFKADYIEGLIQKHPDFKKRWLKGVFLYALRIGRGLQFLERAFATEKELRRFIEGSEVKFIKANDMLPVENGAYIFEGQVQSDGSTYGRGNFISQNRSIQALTDASILVFNEIVGLKVHQQRMSVVNQ